MLSCILKGGTASSGKPKKSVLDNIQMLALFLFLLKKVKSICPFSQEMSPLLQFVLKKQRYF